MKNKMMMFSVVFLSAFALMNSSFANTLNISTKGEQLLYDKDTLTVEAGAKVTLVFTNASSGMPHNWVLVKPGTMDKVAQDSLAAGADKGWLAKGPNVLAHTKMVEPKQKDTITFTAPATVGDYPYVCTFPGHAAMMKGTLKVVKAKK